MGKNIENNKSTIKYTLTYVVLLAVVISISLWLTYAIAWKVFGPEPTMNEVIKALLGIAFVGVAVVLSVVKEPRKRKQVEAQTYVENKESTPVVIATKVFATLVLAGVILGSVLYVMVMVFSTVVTWSIPPASLLLPSWAISTIAGIVFVFIFFGKTLWRGQKRGG